ncbi:MAG: class I SAM-dependent methyltransferase [Planctomycetaceae bacterium]
MFRRNGRVYRALDDAAAREWESALRSGFVLREMDAGRIVRTTGVSPPPPGLYGDRWAGVVEHSAVPFISYPYEWTFGMLRDAALLQLELIDAALEEALIFKDATPYNLQFCDASPVFIDTASIVRYTNGEPWAGYRQFCELFLNPLLLQACRGVEPQSLLRGSLDGISPETLSRMLSLRDLFRRGVFAHVFVHARMQRQFRVAERDTRQSLKSHGFGKKLIRANVHSLRRMVERLQWRGGLSTWSDYESRCPHVQIDLAAKEAFVRTIAAARRRRLVWDLGCNVGRFSLIAAEHADCVVAMDSDQQAVDALYGRLRGERVRGVLPLVVDLADPSPARGWRGLERRDLPSRGRPDLTLCLAVLHHLVIGRNVLLQEVVDWFAELGTELVIEFVAKEDPQTQILLRNRPDQYADYKVESFERLLSERFRISRRETLPSGTRTLFYATPLAATQVSC